MKMLPSIAITVIITSAVWGAVWAQQLSSTGTIAGTSKTHQNELTLPKSLVGISAVSDYASSEQTAKQLFSEFTSSPTLLSQLKNIKEIHIYLVYRAISSNQLEISASIEPTHLTKHQFNAVQLPAHKYRSLAPKGSDLNQLVDAWKHINGSQGFGIIIENYRLTAKGSFIDGYSLISDPAKAQ